jgi:DNA modification methylase
MMGTLFESKAAIEPDYMRKKKAVEKRLGHSISNAEFEDKYLEINRGGGRLSDTGTSIFDPVLTETIISWFTACGDKVIDPFAGGSVRGIVTNYLGRDYTGVDLRNEQIEANIEQGKELLPDAMPKWICGDSMNTKQLADGEYDFMLTCPPYGNLEIYSDDPADISNMSDDDFDKTYCEILRRTVEMLKDDRFAAVVVGNYRDKKGYLRDLVGLTVKAMENAGARYYNDFVIVTPIGSLPIRAGKAFQSSRKMGRTHQYCLIFVKGDPKKAAERLGEVEIADMEQYVEDEE